MFYYIFLAMNEPRMPDHFNGLNQEVIIPGCDYEEAERNARTMLGARYRGASTIPVTQVLTIRI